MAWKSKRFMRNVKKYSAPTRHVRYAKKALKTFTGKGDDDEARSSAAGQMVRKTITRQGGSGAFTYGEDVYE